MMFVLYIYIHSYTEPFTIFDLTREITKINRGSKRIKGSWPAVTTIITTAAAVLIMEL